MNKATSLYLDLVRLFAALVVLVYHFAYERFSGGGLQFIRDSHIGSDAVMLFFVLSGYVIAYVVVERDQGINDYLVNRLSRLWSVVIPALVLTVLVDQLGLLINPAAYEGWWYQADHPLFRTFANLFFVNELWFKSIRPFTNGPFWSLGYEFWYYVIFASAFYFSGILRLVLVVLSCLIAGPKILLLFPIWLLGVWVWRFNQRSEISVPQGWLLFIIPVVLYWLIKQYGIDQAALHLTGSLLKTDDVGSVLGFSDEFLISYVYGGLIAMNFIGIHAIAPVVEKALRRFEKPIRYWAGLTFSIYLFHYPLLQFFSAIYDQTMNTVARNGLLLLSALLVIVIVGNLTEKKKHFARHLIKRMLILLRRFSSKVFH